ncbi:MAG TPA: MarR family transcriptional regulator [Streptomyces sp.]|uniref:GbsR/MarR family transcriptional regulator n=1 Tax=Streptomyces sp. TaxID=1931 RepID=UPI002D538DB4|nr:MarR family transcriptional regulator [Streptomyces sp.]HZG03994.1 MarR family transcriptional regulator [Streptomyces sp.]
MVENEKPDKPNTTQPYGAEVADFVERFAAELTEAGMQRMASRVFACLLVEPSGALGSAELSERLRVSPAAVSGAVRYLSQVHLITREREPGSRRERYRAHADTWYAAVADRDALLGRWIATFERGVKAVGPDSPAGRRLAETAEFFAFLRSELSRMMDRWYAHREALRSGEEEGTAGSVPSR